jgi:riboflavin synthase
VPFRDTMFTGLIEEIGVVSDISRGVSSARIIIAASGIAADTAIGDSISVSGVCLTVVSKEETSLAFEAIPETLSRSALKAIGPSDRVNLERAVAAGQRMGGHFVQGHVDGTGTLKSLRVEDNARVLTVTCGSDLLRYMVSKGSVALDGISLTLVDVTRDAFTVWIIPHTWEQTCLQFRKSGNEMNIEVDMIARHIEKLMTERSGTSGLTFEKLVEAGFAERGEA